MVTVAKEIVLRSELSGGSLKVLAPTGNEWTVQSQINKLHKKFIPRTEIRSGV